LRSKRGGRESGSYGCNHAVQTIHNIAVRKSQDTIALATEKCRAGAIMIEGHIMRLSVNFHNQLMFAAQKVGKIGTDRHLSAELCIGYLATL
jgi:hypothetical protein